MKQKLVIGPISKGLRNDVTPFNVDNDAFPTLINAYQWRKRIRRKRGTSFVSRLTRYFDSTSTAFNPGSQNQTLALVTGIGNLLTGFSGSGIQSTAQIQPGTVTVTGIVSAINYTDPAKDGTLSPSGTINYATGEISIVAEAGQLVKATFRYFPGMPVLGLEPFVQDVTDFPKELGFDKTYSYNISLFYSGDSAFPYSSYSVSFYNNPAISASFPGYVPKGTWTPALWNLEDYQQIWTTNFQGALWATPGIKTGASTVSNVGMQFKRITAASVSSPTDVLFTTDGSHPFIEGDFVFINEVNSIVGLNMQSGYVLGVPNAPNPTATTFTARFPTATISGGPGNTGIVQALTTSCQPNISSTTPTNTRDCIRFYNGDPITNAVTPTFTKGFGWANFCPPLTTGSVGTFSISDLPPAQYYLVGARMIVPYKDRLLFFGPVVQTSAQTPNPIYLQDTVIYSQNGTPYYTAAFPYGTNNYPTIPQLINTQFVSILTPANQTAQPQAFFENAQGFGGFISAGFSRPITSVSLNEDALIVGFADRQARLLYTGNDALPFNFYIINSELGSDATFSTITLDRGVLSVGGRGIILTAQNTSQRIDLDIIDQIFQLKLIDSGSRRVCAQRDFINEWVYFTYPSNSFQWRFPTQTLQYNYREDTWGLFNETYTTYGTVRFNTGNIWQQILTRWDDFNAPWNSGDYTTLQPEVIAGNQQGFIIQREQNNTDESNSLFIKDIVSGLVTCPDHCLNTGDFIVISNCLGTIGSLVNGKIFRLSVVDANSFQIDVDPGTYLGNGVIKRIYRPYIQTKQFPVSWEYGRKTRIGDQQYLLSKTANGKITLLIFLSQNAAEAYNTGPIVPDSGSINNALIYSTILDTNPERYIQQANNASLGSIGNGVITTFTFNYTSEFSINGSLVPGTTTINVGSVATFTDNGSGIMVATGTGLNGTIDYSSTQIVINFAVAPTNESTTTSFSFYYPDIQNPTSIAQSQIWHRVSTSLLGDTVQLGITLSDEQMEDPTFSNQFVEIELHSIAIDLYSAGDLA